MKEDLGEEIYERLTAYISERTGVARAQLEAVLEAEARFWYEHPNLTQTALELGEDDEF